MLSRTRLLFHCPWDTTACGGQLAYFSQTSTLGGWGEGGGGTA